MKQRDVPLLTGAGILPSTVWRLSPDWRGFQCQRGVYFAWSLPATVFNNNTRYVLFFRSILILRIEHFLLHLVEEIYFHVTVLPVQNHREFWLVSRNSRNHLANLENHGHSCCLHLKFLTFRKKKKNSFEEATQKEGGKSLTKQKKRLMKKWATTRLTLNILRFPPATNSLKEMDWRFSSLVLGFACLMVGKKTFKHLHTWWSSSGIPSTLTWREDHITAHSIENTSTHLLCATSFRFASEVNTYLVCLSTWSFAKPINRGVPSLKLT